MQEFLAGYLETQQSVTNWNAAVALLARGIAEIPPLVEKPASESMEKGLDSLAEKLKDVGNKEVMFVDTNGKEITKKIKDILVDQIKEIAAGGFPDAPGIELTIVDLGLELAEIQQKALELRLLRLSRRAELYEETYGEIKLARELLNESISLGAMDKGIALHTYLLRAIAQARTLERKMIKTTQTKTFEGGSFSIFYKASEDFRKTIDRMAGILQSLRKLTLADSMSLRSQTVLNLTAARLDHEDSILEAQVNDKAWHALFKSGAESLVAYHKGGLRREDVANIIRLAQTLALGTIAEQVD